MRLIVDEPIKKTPPEQESIDFVLDGAGKQVCSPKSLIGYYRSILTRFADEIGNNISVVVSYNEKFVPDNTHPVIYLSRGSIGVDPQSAPGTKFAPAPGIKVPEEANAAETLAGCSALSQEMRIIITSASRSELEVVSYRVFSLLLASSDDVLQMFFSNVHHASEPVMSEIAPMPSHSNYYSVSIQWRVSYVEQSVLALKRKMLQYLRLEVRDKDAVDILRKEH